MSNELEEYLASLERSSRFRVLDVLKSSTHETTEVVELQSDDGAGARGPFIRKRISSEAGVGWIYARLFEEQRAGNVIPFIPWIYECYVTEDGLNVVMEYVQGRTLADLLYEADPSIELAARVFPGICDAVGALHERFDPPIIHRDLKPSNIMIGAAGVKIIDFGIARSFRANAESDTKHFGTSSYAPPEQFGYGQTDERSDVYALGKLLYYCLTEHTPAVTLTDAQLTAEGIIAPLRRVILKATAFDPASRYGSATELKTDFLKALRMREPAAATPSEVTMPATAIAPVSGSSLVADAQSAASINGQPGPKAASPESAAAEPVSGGSPLPTSSVSPTPMPSASPSASRVPTQPSLSESTPQKPRTPKALGWIWNILVVLLWALWMMGSVFAVTDPTETNALLPTGLLILEYPVLMGLSGTFIAYGLLYKGYIRQRMPLLFPKTSLCAAISIIGAVGSLMLAVIILAIAEAAFA